MKVLVIMHDESEGPGSLEEYWEFYGVEIATARLYAGEALPGLSDFDAVVSMGGNMNVYEDNLYPFLATETDFLGEAIQKGIPVLGICLGAQLIARACGAEITKATVKEVGFSEVVLTDQGRHDLLFRGLPERTKVFQWHEDTFALPRGASRLATSEVCPEQAFRYRNAFGLQFHVEVNEEILLNWFSYSKEKYYIMDQYQGIKYIMAEEARKLCFNFADLVKRKHRTETQKLQASRSEQISLN